jgi:lipoyl(octanoyl) transferase
MDSGSKMATPRSRWWAETWFGAAYTPLWALQTALVEARREGGLEADVALFVEHTPVFTLGRRGGMDNVRVSPAFLERSGIPVVHVERGGDITYHGPGQLVIYPIVDLPRARLKVVTFVEGLEEVMIRVAADCGVRAGRSTRNRGVWVGEKKLGSVGIAVRRGISFHGLALNVDPDLMPFQWIHPCGLQEVRMTSLALEGAEGVTLDSALHSARFHLEEIFQAEIETVDGPWLTGWLEAEDPEAAAALKAVSTAGKDRERSSTAGNVAATANE